MKLETDKMKSLLNNLNATVANVVLFCAGCAMAGLGLAFLGLTAVFAFAAAGLALLVSPFVALARRTNPHDEDHEGAAAA